MAGLTPKQRVALPAHAFAYVDSRGQRRLPIYDKAHVRAALARFEQVRFETDAARDEARRRLLKAARKFGVSPVGFIETQFRNERRRGAADTRAARLAALPTGLVTFLMADIEGSTGLLAHLGDAYAALLTDFRRRLRGRVRHHGGHEVEAHADEYLAAFNQPADAVTAAVDIQRRMAAGGWPQRAAVKVRIGIHRGHPTKTDTGYVGLSVHATARICQAAHGGQVIVSRWVHDALVDDLPDGLSLLDLGAYKLRSFPRPDSLFQVAAAELEVAFPPLRTEAQP